MFWMNASAISLCSLNLFLPLFISVIFVYQSSEYCGFNIFHSLLMPAFLGCHHILPILLTEYNPSYQTISFQTSLSIIKNFPLGVIGDIARNHLLHSTENKKIDVFKVSSINIILINFYIQLLILDCFPRKNAMQRILSLCSLYPVSVLCAFTFSLCARSSNDSGLLVVSSLYTLFN